MIFPALNLHVSYGGFSIVIFEHRQSLAPQLWGMDAQGALRSKWLADVKDVKGCKSVTTQWVWHGMAKKWNTPQKSKRFIITTWQIMLAQTTFSNMSISLQKVRCFCIACGARRIDGLDITATSWKSTHQRVRHPTATSPRVPCLRWHMVSWRHEKDKKERLQPAKLNRSGIIMCLALSVRVDNVDMVTCVIGHMCACVCVRARVCVYAYWSTLYDIALHNCRHIVKDV